MCTPSFSSSFRRPVFGVHAFDMQLRTPSISIITRLCMAEDKKGVFLLGARRTNNYAKHWGEDEVGRAFGSPCESSLTGFSRTK